MSTILTSIAPIWKVLLVGLVLGAGLPAIFALGLRFWSPASAGTDGTAAAPVGPAGRIGAVVCFLIVALVVVAGIVVLAASKTFLARFGLS